MQVTGTQFSLCSVIGGDVLRPHPIIDRSIPLDTFIYGKIWKDTSLDKCVHYSRVATKGETLNYSQLMSIGLLPVMLLLP